MEEKKKAFWGKDLNTVEDCEKFIKETYYLLLGMAGLMLLLSLVLKQFFILLPDVIFMSVCALLLKKYQSRSVATMVFLYSLSIFVVTLGNKLHLPFAKNFGGGNNIILASILVYATFKTLQATIKLFKLRNYAVCWKNFFIKTAIFVVLFIALFFVTGILSTVIPNTAVIGFIFLVALFASMFVVYAGIFPNSDKLKIKYVKEEQEETTDAPCSEEV